MRTLLSHNEDGFQSELECSEERYRRLFESARDGILILDFLSRKITDVNPFMVELLEYSRDEFLGKELWELGLLKDKQASADAFRELQENGYIRYEDLPLKTKAGNQRDVEFVSNVYEENKRQVIQCNIRDITEHKIAQRILKEREESYRPLFESNPHSMWVYDVETLKFLAVNQAAIKRYGYSEAEFLAMTIKEIRPANDVPALLTDLATPHVDGLQRPCRHRRKDGTLIEVEITSRELVFQNCTARIVLAYDVTERKQFELNQIRLVAEVKNERQHLNSIVASVPGVVWETWFQPDAEQQLVNFVSGYVTTMLGYSVDEWLATPNFWLSIVHPEDREKALKESAVFHESHESHDQGVLQMRWIAKDGRIIWVETHMAAIRNQGGHLIGIRGVTIDITDRKQVEKALREREERFRRIFEEGPLGIAVVGLDGYILEANTMLCSMLEYSVNEFKQLTFAEITHPEDVTSDTRLAQQLFTGKISSYHLEKRYLTKSGREVWGSLTGALICDENGNPYHALGILEDITDRKRTALALQKANTELESRVQERTAQLGSVNASLRAEAIVRSEAELLLQQSETRYRAIVDSQTELISRTQSDGTFTFVNDAYCQYFGKTQEELLGSNALELLPEEERDSAFEHWQTFSPEKPVQVWSGRGFVPDGSLRWQQWTTQALYDEHGVFLEFQAVGRDITIRKQTEQALYESEESLRLMVESVQDYAIFMLDPQGNVASWNSGAQRITGYSTTEILGKHFSIFYLPIEIAAGKPAIEIEQAMANGRAEDEGWQVRKDGSSYWSSIVLTPVHDETGQLRGFTEVTRDISERKETEIELQSTKEQAEAANLAKSEFLSRMSHELRTPLNAILGFGQILALDDLPPKRREAVNHILKAGDHLLNLINEVLDISRIEAGTLNLSLEPVPVNSSVRDVLNLLRPLADASNIQLVNQLPLDANWHVLADRQRLQQSLLNLVSNAIKYNRHEGSVYIFAEEKVEVNVLRLAVRDTGIGLSESDIGKIFTPFERLGAGQTQIEGTGIGLSLTRHLVVAMGGVIGVDSSIGSGSTFWIELPLAVNPMQCLDEHLKSEGDNFNFSSIAQRGQKTILYIEDNLANLQLIEMIFRDRTDIRLLSAMQGSTGLDLALQHDIDLILLDLHLPDLSGYEVLQRLKGNSVTAPIPVIVISADATPGQRERLLNAGAKSYLTKPIIVKEFLQVTNEFLSVDV